MSHPRTSGRLAGRVATVSAAFVLAMGATGALGVAFADDNPPTPATSGSPATGSTEDGNAYILSTDGTGTFSLALTVPGTSIAIDYTVDTTGAVTAASTSSAGATVTVDGHDLTVTLADGRTVQVELGDKGDTVDEVETDTPDSASGDSNGDGNGGGDGSDNSDTPEPTDTPDSNAPDSNADEQGDNNDQGASSSAPDSGETDAPEATHSSEPSDSSDSGSSDGGSADGSGSGSDN